MSDLHPVLHSIKFQRTFCMIKPDGVMRGVVGDIIQRIEKAGLKVVAMKMTKATAEQVRAHYPMEDLKWVHRLGDKSLSGFEDLEGVEAKDILGSDDRTVIGPQVAEGLVAYMTSGPVVCIVVEGIQAIEMVRKLAGHTLPFKAAVGTIRGDFSVDSPAIANAEKRSIHNLFHASENEGEADNEIKLWFGDIALQEYRRTGEDIMYDKHY